MRKLLIRKNKDKKYVAAITTIELVLILVILIEKVTSESSGI